MSRVRSTRTIALTIASVTTPKPPAKVRQASSVHPSLHLSLLSSFACGSCTNNMVLLGHDLLLFFSFLGSDGSQGLRGLAATVHFRKRLIPGIRTCRACFAAATWPLLLAAAGSSQSRGGSSMTAAARGLRAVCLHCTRKVKAGPGLSGGPWAGGAGARSANSNLAVSDLRVGPAFFGKHIYRSRSP
jgi:hypothetical protein